MYCRTFKRIIMKSFTISIFATLCLLTFQVKSQQVSQFTQYMNRPSLYNPAASGSEDAICIYGTYRNQWIGFKDQNNEAINPVNYQGGVAFPIYPINSGIGLTFGSVKMGYQSSLNVRLDYAYHFEIDDEQKILAGASIQLEDVTLDFNKLSVTDANEPLLQNPGKQQDMVTQAGFGVMYSRKNRGWAGVSVLNLLGSEAEFENITMPYKMTITAQGLYKFRVIDERKRKFDIAPAFLLKTQFTSTQVDLNVLGYFNDRLWLGAGYRLQDGIMLLGGIQAENLKVGLSYDFTTNQVRKATGAGSAEVHLIYCFPLARESANQRPSSNTDTKTKIRNNNSNRKVNLRSKFNTRYL